MSELLNIHEFMNDPSKMEKLNAAFPELDGEINRRFAERVVISNKEYYMLPICDGKGFTLEYTGWIVYPYPKTGGNLYMRDFFSGKSEAPIKISIVTDPNLEGEEWHLGELSKIHGKCHTAGTDSDKSEDFLWDDRSRSFKERKPLGSDLEKFEDAVVAGTERDFREGKGLFSGFNSVSTFEQMRCAMGKEYDLPQI